MKKWFLTLLSTLTLLLAFTCGASAVTDSTGLYMYDNWGSEQNPSLVIYAYLGTATEITIPSELDGMPVKEIEALGPEDYSQVNTTLTAITLPAGVEFYSGVDTVFSRLNALQAVYAAEDHDRYTSIDGVLFSKTYSNGPSLEYYPFARPGSSYTVPEGTAAIGSGAFSRAANLEEITLPDSIEYMESSIFRACPKLTTVYNFPLTLVQSYSSEFFTNCPVLEAIHYPGTRSQFLTYTFAHETVRTGVTVNDLVVCAGSSRSGDYEYEYSEALGGAVLTDYTGSASSVTVPSAIGGYTVKGLLNTFRNNNTLTSVTIPSTVTEIGKYSFYYCSNLASVTFSGTSQLKTIGDSAFSECAKLTSVTLPASVTSIGPYAFAYCSLLRTVNLSSSLETIGDRAFLYCSALSSLSIPKNVTSIGTNVFQYDSALSSITVASGNTAYIAANNALYNKAKTELIIYAAASTATTFTLPDSVEKIHPYAFYRATSLEDVYFYTTFSSARIAEIGDYAFNGCENLAYLNGLPRSLRKVGSSAFGGCPITYVYYAGSKTQWENNVTCYCSTLTGKLTYNSGHVSHPVCGISCTCENTTHSNVTWSSWGGTSYISSGNYYLTQDATLPTSGLTVTGTLRLCLNGHTLTMTGSGWDGISVEEGGTLILCDCTTNSSAAGGIQTPSTVKTYENVIYNAGDLIIWGGTYDNTPGDGQTCIYSYSNSTLTMYRGTVRGGMTGIHANGTTAIYGGTISGGDFGLSNGGTLTLQNVTIKGGSGYRSAALLNSGPATTVMNSGYLLVNSGATSTGGLLNYGTFTLNSGTIDCGSRGWGVRNEGKLHLNGGQIYYRTYFSASDSGYSPAVFNSSASARCYLSGDVTARLIQTKYPDTVIAGNSNGTVPYAGLPIQLIVDPYYYGAGDAIVTAVKDEETAALFSLLMVENQTGLSMRHTGTELQLVQVLDSGTCGAEGDNLIWTFDSDGVLTVSGEGDMADYKQNSSNSYSTAPWVKYNDELKKVVAEEGVTSIGAYAFWGSCDVLTAAELPETLTSIGEEAFRDSALLSISFPDSLTYIGESAFEHCDYLAITALPKNVTVYQPYTFRHAGAFRDIPVTSLTIPEGVTEIGAGAFAEWYNVTELYLPSTLVTVHEQALYKNRITSVIIPASVEYLGTDAFGWSGEKCLKSVYFCGNAPDASDSSGRPFSSDSNVKLYVREGSTGFLTSGYYIYTRDIWADADHCTVKGNYVSAPSCTEGGYTEYFCPLSGCLYKAYDGSAPLPHTEEAFPQKDATLTEDGHTAGTRCSVCGELLSGGEVIPAIGPTLAAGVSVAYDSALHSLTITNAPAEMRLLLAAYDGDRLCYVTAAAGGSTVQIFLPQEVSLSQLKLFFLTEDYQPMALPRTFG